MTEPGELPLKRQAIENLEAAFKNLEATHRAFNDAAQTYRACKQAVPFVNTPWYLKHKWPKFIYTMIQQPGVPSYVKYCKVSMLRDLEWIWLS